VLDWLEYNGWNRHRRDRTPMLIWAVTAMELADNIDHFVLPRRLRFVRWLTPCRGKAVAYDPFRHQQRSGIG